jgi:hypothetical protein
MQKENVVKLANEIYDDYRHGFSEWSEAFNVVETVIERAKVKELQHHKDTTVGLYAFDQELDKIFDAIPDKESCKTAVEAYLVQQIEYLKSIVFRVV